MSDWGNLTVIVLDQSVCKLSGGEGITVSTFKSFRDWHGCSEKATYCSIS